jgi:hypothetical protein
MDWVGDSRLLQKQINLQIITYRERTLVGRRHEIEIRFATLRIGTLRTVREASGRDSQNDDDAINSSHDNLAPRFD